MASTGGQQVNEEDKLILSLPRERGWMFNDLYLFQEFWCPTTAIHGVKNYQKYFRAKENDVIVASFPKSGTTWLKALTFAIVNHPHFSSIENHPLLTSNPHELVPFLEIIFASDIYDPIVDLSNINGPRVFSTHTPFSSLLKSIMGSNCKIIYICRNPFDIFVSSWIFYDKVKSGSIPPLTLEGAFDMYCNGIIEFGPWWDHMLGYWKESIARPNNVLFLKYEDLKEDVNFHVKKIADFLSCPFTEEEERNRVIENIIKLCSFEKMKDLEVNKSGMLLKMVENKCFFRKAKVGDWVNYFLPSMIEKLAKIIERKLSGSGLSFKMHSQN